MIQLGSEGELSYPQGIELTLRKDFKQKSTVSGIAKSDNKLFILCEGINKIAVYQNSQPLPKYITATNLISPRDIVLCNGILCISDSTSNCIWKLEGDQLIPTDTEVTPVKWIDDILNPYTLSATLDGGVIVTTEKSNKVFVYGPNGDLTREVLFSDSAHNVSALHAIQRPNGNIVVSYKKLDVTRWRWFVSEFVRTPGGNEINSAQLPADLINSRYLALVCQPDRKDVCLLAADFDQSSIIRMDGNLKPHSVLLSNKFNKIQHPRRMCYDAASNELAITTNNRHILVYSLKVVDYPVN